jgi:hypothetical protein
MEDYPMAVEKQDSTENESHKKIDAKLAAWLGGETDLPIPEAYGCMKQWIEHLIDDGATERKRKQVEVAIWQFFMRMYKPFCCGGVGYLLFGDGVPIAVSRDDPDFDRLLIYLGIHPGSPMRDRVGRFIGTMCHAEGIKTETRLAFHFEPSTLTAYMACYPGALIKLNRWGFDVVENGTDGQLFLFPKKWQPLFSKPLDDIGDGYVEDGTDFPKSDMCTRSLFPDGHLVTHLFGGTSFEIRSMSEKQVRILVMAYIMFLMLPGVVSERAMLQALGPSGRPSFSN